MLFEPWEILCETQSARLQKRLERSHERWKLQPFKTNYSVSTCLHTRGFNILTISLKKITLGVDLLNRNCQLYDKAIKCQKNSAFCSVTMHYPAIASPRELDPLWANAWLLIQHLQREIYKKPTLYYFLFYQAWTSFLACQHFDFICADWFSNNLHVSCWNGQLNSLPIVHKYKLAAYLWTMGREFNCSFQQTFVGEEPVMNP